MILVIDNFDSFTYNIVQYLSKLNVNVLVKRNNEVSVLDIEQLKPSHIVISPGPNTPKEAGVSLKIISHFAGRIPILGVCLGHQAIADAFGATIVRAAKPVHGKTSLITHKSLGVFADLPNPLKVTRYHSLIIDKQTLPPEFEITAWTTTETGNIDEIMAIKHRKLPIEGVQFHPESILSQEGLALFNNFLCQN